MLKRVSGSLCLSVRYGYYFYFLSEAQIVSVQINKYLKCKHIQATNTHIIIAIGTLK